MKNPLELSLLEIAAMMREAGESAPEPEYTVLLAWVHERQKYLHDFAVQTQREVIKQKVSEISRREVRSLERELLDNAPIEIVEIA